MSSVFTIEVQSRRRLEMIDITAEVRRALRELQVQDGLAVIFTPHTTAAVTINENADPDVQHDLLEFFSRRVPAEEYFLHGEGNSPAHILSSVIGAAETIIVADGAPLLGTWQGIYFCECDGPRRRRVLIKAIRDGA